ncbi:MAG: tetratricopeptide repeat protein [Planctomycetota bacterium]|jgi:TolA-binding protein
MEIKNDNLKQSYNSKPKRDAKVPDVVLKTGMFSTRKFKSSSTSSFKFYFCVLRFSFLAFCLLASFANAEISSEQLDPIDFLTSNLALTSQDVNTPNASAKTSQDVNTPNITTETLKDVNKPNVTWLPDALFRLWEPTMQVAKLQLARQEQLQISPANCRITDVNSANEATWPFEWKKTLAPSAAEGEVSFLTQWLGTSTLVQDDSKKRSQLPQDSLPVAQSSNNHPAHQLWQARISIAYVEKDKRNKNELQRIIEQIRSVEFEPQEKVVKPVIVVVEPNPTTEPNETSSATEAPQESEVQKIELKLPYEPLKDQTLQMLKSLLQHPERLHNPFQLGEILFLSGHLKDAAICYQEALSRCSPDKADPNQKPQQDTKVADAIWKTGTFSIRNRAWILFQIGNCLRDVDPTTSMKMYRQIIAEYPDSPWADLAKARSKLIDWFQKDKPRTLIAENQF